MKRVLLSIAVLLLVFGFFVMFGKKNFPPTNAEAEKALCGTILSLNPYDIPDSEYVEIMTENGPVVRRVISFRDFADVGKKDVEVSDTVILYTWNGKFYLASKDVDWGLFMQKVNADAKQVYAISLALGFAFLCAGCFYNRKAVV